MALVPSNSSNLEQLALKGLTKYDKLVYVSEYFLDTRYRGFSSNI